MPDVGNTVKSFEKKNKSILKKLFLYNVAVLLGFL